ncbi:MAG: hypothetical protein WKF77_21940 [Planctomycetaceae bacterium]
MRVLRLLLCYWSLLAAFASCVTAQNFGVPIRISKETTYITSPLRNDGTVDYIEALSQRQREGVTAENNSVVMFQRALGHGNLPAETTAEYFRQLGIEALPKAGQYLIDLDDFLETLDSSKKPQRGADGYERKRPFHLQLSQARARSWTRIEFPVIARWVDANETPLSLVVQGSKRPKSFAPMPPSDRTLVTSMLPEVASKRLFAELLCARAMLKLGEEDPDAAWEDVIACHRISRLVAQGPGIIHVFVALAIEPVACRCDDQIAHHGNLSKEQAMRFLADVQALGPIFGMADNLGAWERIVYLDTVHVIARRDPDYMLGLIQIFDDNNAEEAVKNFVSQSYSRDLIDWNLVLQRGNEWCDKLVSAGHIPTRIARHAKIDELDNELLHSTEQSRAACRTTQPEDMKTVSDVIGALLLGEVFPTMTTAFEAEDKCSMRTELSYCAFALAAWKADHGSYPDQLAPLVPAYLTTIPIDTFTGESLIYRRSGTGYRLYSLGVNLKDDDGFTLTDTNETDDIVIRTPDEDRRIKAVVGKQPPGN